MMKGCFACRLACKLITAYNITYYNLKLLMAELQYGRVQTYDGHIQLFSRMTKCFRYGSQMFHRRKVPMSTDFISSLTRLWLKTYFCRILL
jgi:hypothetical protein